MVHDSPENASQCTRGVSKEYQKDELDPELEPTYFASARLRIA
jgi:hypothetical protein